MFQTIHLRKLASSLALTLGCGILAGFLSRPFGETYANLNRPPFSPPGAVFGIVWSVLYLLMGLALYTVRLSRTDSTGAKRAFAVQLLLNFFWPLWFFRWNLYGVSAVWLMALLAAVVVTTVRFYRVKPISGWLLVPYLVWCVFALYLNLGTCLLN